MFDKNKLRTL